MPKIKAKPVTDLLSTIKANVKALTDEPEDTYDDTKRIVCKFYKEGKHPGCKGCTQPEDQLIECKSAYLTSIESRPMQVWAKEFSALSIRPKQKVKEILDMGLACDSCYMADNCPLFEAKALCAIDWEEEGSLEPKDVVSKLIQIQFQRVNRGSKIELIDGGVPDQTLSSEMDRLSSLIQQQSELGMDKFQLNINARSNPNSTQAPGILSALLGRGNPSTALPAPPVTINIPHTEVVKKEKQAS